MKDVLRPYVPEYKGQVTSDDGECKYNLISECCFLLHSTSNITAW